MMVTCIKCKRTMFTAGKYFEDNFKDNPNEYICLGCNAKKTT